MSVQQRRQLRSGPGAAERAVGGQPSMREYVRHFERVMDVPWITTGRRPAAPFSPWRRDG
ncbi:hypothetical protein [Streptomyces boninensis]|uniref:hypothetical protein n=1 Tax=Streptomyces boninensis TaxID=2039455 RepID=UPI003B20E4ED